MRPLITAVAAIALLLAGVGWYFYHRHAEAAEVLLVGVWSAQPSTRIAKRGGHERYTRASDPARQCGGKPCWRPR